MARMAAARLAVWAVLSAACAGGDDGAGRGDAAPPAPFRSALIGEPAPPPAPFVLALTSPGAEPRRALRYHVTPGARERTRISVTNEIDVLIAGRRIQRSTPPTIVMAFEIEAAARPGGYRCTAWINDTASADWERMAPGSGNELRAALEKLRGHHITFEVDERGHPVSSDISLPDSLENHRDAALEILRGVESSVVPFPAEPVGVGAVWTAADDDAGRSSNLAGAVVTTYTLVAMRGDHLELSMQLGLPAEPAPLSLTGTEVSGYSGAVTTGTVKVAVDLGRLLPVSNGGFEIDLQGRTFTGAEELPFRVLQKIRHQVDSR